jgi:hemolysin III
MMYIAMGWLIVIAFGPMVEELSTTTIAWLLAGGAAYTLGTLFYHRDSLPYAHAIWHLFVLAGSSFHFVAVSTQVLASNY